MRLLALLAAGLLAGTTLVGCGPVASDKKSDEKAMDEELVLGTWQAEKYDTEGADDPSADTIARVRMTFKKDGKVALPGPGDQVLEGTFKLDPTAKPKAIDITQDTETMLGVYELDGDRLTLAMAQRSKTRPAEMKADGKNLKKDGSGVILVTFKRVKDEKKDK